MTTYPPLKCRLSHWINLLVVAAEWTGKDCDTDMLLASNHFRKLQDRRFIADNRKVVKENDADCFNKGTLRYSIQMFGGRQSTARQIENSGAFKF